MIAVMDCNNFFVSCERVFRPDLKTKPVVVLSNNDGCIVSRSNEAKALEIPVGIPLFKVRNIIIKNKVQTFSSNFVLYGDLSNRVMYTLKQLVGDIEPYSIDEAFFECEDLKKAIQIRDKIIQDTSIPVSIGLGQTKTQAKAANEMAKKSTGTFEITNLTQLKNLPIENVWGIGRAYSAKLKSKKIQTAFDLIQKDDKWILAQMNKPGLITTLELRGIPAKESRDPNSKRKSVISSRSFGKPITTLTQLKEAISSYTENAARRLRRDQMVAKQITTYIKTKSPHHHKKYYTSIQTQTLEIATSSTPILIKAAHQNLENIFKPNEKYKKAGVMLTRLCPENQIQLNLFKKYQDQNSTMQIMDYLNEKFGRNTLYPASSGIKKSWSMKSELRSPDYTTDWNQLPEVTI